MIYFMRITNVVDQLPHGVCPWHVDDWIFWRPEQVDECYGPGGFATWSSTKDHTDAWFTTDREEAKENLEDFHKRYPHVTAKIVTFVEVLPTNDAADAEADRALSRLRRDQRKLR